MNDLLFTALTLATLYYFFYYLPNQEKLSTPEPISLADQCKLKFSLILMRSFLKAPLMN